jgi:hypothetical protein
MIVIFMIVIVIIILCFALCIISFTHNSIVARRNIILNNARIHLNIRQNYAVGIEPSTAESTICSDINEEEKRGPELL